MTARRAAFRRDSSTWISNYRGSFFVLRDPWNWYRIRTRISLWMIHYTTTGKFPRCSWKEILESNPADGVAPVRSRPALFFWFFHANVCPLLDLCSRSVFFFFGCMKSAMLVKVQQHFCILIKIDNNLLNSKFQKDNRMESILWTDYSTNLTRRTGSSHSVSPDAGRRSARNPRRKWKN